MNTLLDTLSGPGWVHLVKALLHSLWLGVCWVAVLGAALRGCGNNPERRYRYALGALMGLVGSVFIAWAVQDTQWKRPETAPESTSVTTVVASHWANPAADLPAVVGGTKSRIPWSGIFALLWAVGFVAMAARLLMQIVASERLRRASTVLESGPIWDLLEELKKRVNCERLVRVASNPLTVVPSVVGVFAPTILLPASLLAGMPVEHLRAVLLHELAHIRRHDYVINLAQQVIEALLFFNPAVWWINRQVRLEREACCDRTAVAAASDKVYAAALTEFAQKAYEAHSALQPAFPGDGRPSSVLERVRRLLVPDYQPIVRLPWHSSLAVLFMAGLALFGTWRGTKLAVTFAAELLTAEKRIEKIADLKAKIGPVERTYTEGDNITIEGQVRTEDGKPLPKNVLVSVHVVNASISEGFTGIQVKNGHFRREVKYGDVSLSAWAYDGNYAPVFVGPLRTEPGGSITNLDLVLPNGFSSRMKVTDAGGAPLLDVQLDGVYQMPNGSVPIKLATDSNGVAVAEHCIDAPMRWTLSRHEFQDAVRENVRLAPEGETVWQLQAARPTTGEVVSKDGGKPIAGARVKLLFRAGGSVVGDLASMTTLATTDQNGRFRIDSFPDGVQHILAVEAPGHATTLVREVEAGRSGLRVELGGEITLRGEIRGDLSQLLRMPDPVISVANPIQINPSSYHRFNRTVHVQTNETAATFAISNLWEGEVLITAGAKEFAYILHEPKTNLVLELEPRKPEVALREITVKFNVPANAPPVRGQLAVMKASIEDAGVYRREFFPVTNAQVKFRAPAGSYVSWLTRGIVGYWISENSNTAVTEGSEPMVIQADAIPAGAIHGAVKDADGSELGGVMVSIVEVKPAPGKPAGGLGDVGKNQSTPDDGPTRFVAQPLPLGGEYMVLAHRGNQYSATEIIKLTEKEPIQEIELRLVKGEELSGTVTDAQGKPLAGIPVGLEYRTPFGQSFGIAGPWGGDAPLTDTAGRFKIAHLNRALPGAYWVTIDHAPGFQPVSKAINLGKPLQMKLTPGQSLSITVINDKSGKPLRGAKLSAMATDMVPGDITNLIQADQPSDADGRVEFTKLSAREYNLYCSDGEIVSPGRQLRIPRTEREPLVIRLKPHQGARLWEHGELTAN